MQIGPFCALSSWEFSTSWKMAACKRKTHDQVWSRWLNRVVSSIHNRQWAQTTATIIIDKGPKQKRGNRRTVCFAQCRTPIQSPLQRKITTANLFSRKSKFVFPNSSRGWSGCVGLRANPRCRQHGTATAPTTIATCRRPPSPSWEQAQCSWSKSKSKLGGNLSLNLDQDISFFLVPSSNWDQHIANHRKSYRSYRTWYWYVNQTGMLGSLRC